MIFTWLIAGVVAGFLLGTFLEEIMDWAKEVFENLSSSVRKAWVYIRRIPGGIKQMIRFIQNGKMVKIDEPKNVEWEDVVEMYKNGKIDEKTFKELEENHEKEIAELNRDR